MRALAVTALVVGCLAAAARAEIIDRIAVTVDKDVITESELLLAIRITALLNGAEPEFSAEAKRAAAERLIDQLLLRREMRVTRYPEPSPEEVAGQLDAVKKMFAAEGGYLAALGRYGVTEAELTGALQRQAAVLRFIDLRFAPEVQVLEPELMEYFYRVCAQKLRESGIEGNIGFDEYRNDCEPIMVSERVDQRVETWLKDARGRARIRYQEDAFK
jgi:hypothetical protein